MALVEYDKARSSRAALFELSSKTGAEGTGSRNETPSVGLALDIDNAVRVPHC